MTDTPGMEKASPPAPDTGHDAVAPDAGERRRSLAIGLLRAREAVMSHFRPLLAVHDVTEQQWRVLRVLCEAGMLDATEVSDKAFILAPSLTRIIRTLEDRGLITRRRDEGDGRRVLLEITPSGLTIFEAVMPENAKVYADLNARFGTERMRQMLDMLDDLAGLKLESPREGDQD